MKNNLALGILSLADTSADTIYAALCAHLNDDEQQHFANMRYEKRQREWAGGRWLARQLLEQIAGHGNFTIIAKGGKPAIENHQANSPALHCNWSHSGDWVMAIATTVGACGCDIEQPNARRNGMKLARRQFAASEVSALEALPENEQQAAFYRLWTLKEALVKCSGEGISGGMKSPAFPQAVPHHITQLTAGPYQLFSDAWQECYFAAAVDAANTAQQWRTPTLYRL